MLNVSTKTSEMIKQKYAYTLCGLRTITDFKLTGLVDEGYDFDFDISVQIAPGRSPIAEHADKFVVEHSVERSLIAIRGVSDFEVANGRHIRIWPANGAKTKDIEIFLQGPVWATLCHQRGMLPLHASAIVSNGSITVFAGHSGAGKSTVAALMASMGNELIADDILAVSWNHNSVPGAWPYLRRQKLHNDSLTKLGLAPDELVSDTFDTEKYYVYPKCVYANKWRPLRRIYVVEITSEKVRAIEKISGAEAVGLLVDQTYHFNYVLRSSSFRPHLVLCANLAEKVDVYRVQRPRSSASIRHFGETISAHMSKS